jgi:hypothetical protein
MKKEKNENEKLKISFFTNKATCAPNTTRCDVPNIKINNNLSINILIMIYKFCKD